MGITALLNLLQQIKVRPSTIRAWLGSSSQPMLNTTIITNDYHATQQTLPR